MRYKCFCTYDGSDYCGWQRQPKVRTVQGVIEEALKNIYLEPIAIHGASRTDKGVHGIGQVFHYDAEMEIPIERLSKVINRQLPPTIHILSVKEETSEFHSRFSCLGKEYTYRIETNPQKNVFMANYIYAYERPLNLEVLNNWASYFIGTCDYRAFMASGSDKEVTVRTIYAIEFELESTQLTMRISGSGFLYNMVRIMVGMFLDLYEEKYTIDKAREHFLKGDRQFFRRTAPACGLYLTKTFY